MGVFNYRSAENKKTKKDILQLKLSFSLECVRCTAESKSKIKLKLIKILTSHEIRGFYGGKYIYIYDPHDPNLYVHTHTHTHTHIYIYIRVVWVEGTLTEV